MLHFVILYGLLIGLTSWTILDSLKQDEKIDLIKDLNNHTLLLNAHETRLDSIESYNSQLKNVLGASIQNLSGDIAALHNRISEAEKKNLYTETMMYTMGTGSNELRLAYNKHLYLRHRQHLNVEEGPNYENDYR